MAKPLTSSAAILYVRKSTQEEEERSLNQQEQALREYAEREGWQVVAVLRETQSAYALRERPKFTEAMKLAEEHKGVLVVWSLDRFSRQGAESVVRLFPRSGKAAPFRLVGTNDGTDTADPARRFETILRAELALQESERLGSRIRRSRADARGRGLWASGNAPYGFRVEGLGNERRLVIVPEKAAVVQRMAAEVIEGKPMRDIARGLNADGVPSPQGKGWHPTTVRAILSNPATSGYLPRGTHAADSLEKRVRSYITDPTGAPVRATWGGVLSEAEWTQVVAALLTAKRTSTGRGNRHRVNEVPLLQGVLKCSTCNRSMVSRRYKDRSQYTCGSPNPTKERHVSAQMATADDVVTRAVLRRLAVLADTNAADPVVAAVAAEWARRTGAAVEGPERSTVEATLSTLRATVERTARMVAEGLVDEATGVAMLTDYRAQVASTEAHLATLPEEPGAAVLGWLADLAQTADDPEGENDGLIWPHFGGVATV